MPSNFRQSCLAPLDSNVKYTSSHILSGTSDVKLGNDILTHRGEGKVNSVFDTTTAATTAPQSTTVVISFKEAKGTFKIENGLKV